MQMEQSNFKAVEWVRQVRDSNHELTQNMSVEERIKFYREASKRFHAHLAALGLAETIAPATSDTLRVHKVV